ncbi:Metallo-beta-lactamase superfamily protein [Marininema mesophilum]|uniref:Metallo-beta-lactamase superfamily protein n=1 Tax=Marininema mesophilum TaxID=1048340 RepID=A0A1H3BGQ7_9BACL|nr:MBL fold metallo-hydrolase [Marininema mesophilum]SDX40229.1 Metallo-beta-lactamase superfamily protein [Marininema mesophilum]
MRKKSAIYTARHQHGEVYALHCRLTCWGQNFHIWVYELDGLLIETGPIRARCAVEEFVKDRRPGSVTLTHHHEDHSGNAGWLTREQGLPLYMGAKTAEILADPYKIPKYRNLVWGQMDKVRGWVADSIETEHFFLRSLATPGHADDHIAWVVEEKGWAFTGDLYLAPHLQYGLKSESIHTMIQSIQSLLALPVDTIFCSHAGIVVEGRQGLEKKLVFLEWLRDETLRLSHQGMNPLQIASRLLDRRLGAVLFSCGELSPVHLIRSIIRDDKR